MRSGSSRCRRPRVTRRWTISGSEWTLMLRHIDQSSFLLLLPLLLRRKTGRQCTMYNVVVVLYLYVCDRGWRYARHDFVTCTQKEMDPYSHSCGSLPNQIAHRSHVHTHSHTHTYTQRHPSAYIYINTYINRLYPPPPLPSVAAGSRGSVFACLHAAPRWWSRSRP